MQVGRKLVAAVITAAVMMCAPAAADAAVSVTLTGDDGQPAVLNPAAPPTIRNMSARATVIVPAPDSESWNWVVTGPDGVPATTQTCWNTLPQEENRVNFRGNGAYKLTVNLFSAANCASLKSTSTYTWTVAASVAVGQPAGPLLTRPVNSAVTTTHLLDFAPNPGAVSYEIRYARGAVLAPDGSISGVSQTATLDSATGKVRFWNFDAPGVYTVVARAQSGDFFTGWSPPANVTLIAPFDLRTASFSDRRGPSYQIRGEVREPSAAGGRVTIAMAKGKSGKRFRTIGKAKINSKGAFKLRFTQRKLGWYRLRYSYKGSSTVAKGTAYAQVRFRRVIF